MAGRYSADTYSRDYNFGPSGSFGSEPQAKPKHSGWEDFLRGAAGIAPAVGTVGGGIIGGILGGGVPGALAGAGIGGAAGTGLGGLANYGADQMDRPQAEAEDARMNREKERQARSQAAMQLLSRYA